MASCSWTGRLLAVAVLLQAMSVDSRKAKKAKGKKSEQDQRIYAQLTKVRRQRVKRFECRYQLCQRDS
jgi:hypothetical protein